MIPMSASAHEFLELEARNNSENIQRSRNALEQERPLPPLPRKDSSLEKVNESEDDSEGGVDEVYSDEDVMSDEEEDQAANSMPKLLNGNNSNGENDGGFDADSTLPPSPSKTSNTSGFNSISSLESPTSPDSERYTQPSAMTLPVWFAISNNHFVSTDPATLMSDAGNGWSARLPWRRKLKILNESRKIPRQPPSML